MICLACLVLDDIICRLISKRNLNKNIDKFFEVMKFRSNQASKACIEMQYRCRIYGPSLVGLALKLSEKYN